MLPSDPSLLVATGILLDVVYNHLEHDYTNEDAAMPVVEWLAWGILSAVYWIFPLMQGLTASSGSSPQLEEAIVEEKPPPRGSGIWEASTLSICLVATSFLSEFEGGSHDWVLVGQFDFHGWWLLTRDELANPYHSGASFCSCLLCIAPESAPSTASVIYLLD